MDTVALLAWTAASLEDGDKHSLATSVILLLHIFDIMVTVEEAITKGQCSRVSVQIGKTVKKIIRSAIVEMSTFRPWQRRRY